MALNIVDWVIIALVAVGGIAAGFTGFFEELSKKLGFILGIWFGLIFTSSLAPVIQNGTGLGRIPSVIISYVAIFIVCYGLTAFVGNVLEKLFETLCLGFVDRMLGFFLGIVETTVVISVIWLLLSSQSVLTLGPVFDDSWVINNVVAKVVFLGKELISA